MTQPVCVNFSTNKDIVATGYRLLVSPILNMFSFPPSSSVLVLLHTAAVSSIGVVRPVCASLGPGRRCRDGQLLRRAPRRRDVSPAVPAGTRTRQHATRDTWHVTPWSRAAVRATSRVTAARMTPWRRRWCWPSWSPPAPTSSSSSCTGPTSSTPASLGACKHLYRSCHSI